VNGREKIAFLHPGWFLAAIIGVSVAPWAVGEATGLLAEPDGGLPVTWPVAVVMGMAMLIALGLPLTLARGIVAAVARVRAEAVRPRWLFPTVEAGVVALSLTTPVILMSQPGFLGVFSGVGNLLGGAVLLGFLACLWRAAAALNRFDRPQGETFGLFLALYFWPIGVWAIRTRLLALRDAATAA
jgi:hypothetical protein